MTPLDQLQYFFFLLVIATLIWLIKNSIKKIRIKKAVYHIPTEKELQTKTKTKRENPLKMLKKQSENAFRYRKNKKLDIFSYYFILLVFGALIITFLFLGKYILTILMPGIFLFASYKILGLIAIPKDNIIREELPKLIQQFIKVLSKTDDLSVVMYESSRHVKEPLRSSFQLASRRITHESLDRVLDDLAKELENMWIFSFVFILSSLKGASKKQDIVKNLMLLSDIVEKEDRQATKAVVEKKGMVMLNWTLLGIAIILFIVHLTVTENGVNFYFNTPIGSIVLVSSMVLAMITSIVNIVLETKK